MAGVVKKKRATRNVGATQLELWLHASGMSPLHRAGLGGLAATLRSMERRHRRGRLRDDQLPQGPDLGGGYPWRIEPTRLTLEWDEPSDAEKYLQRLFTFAFDLRDGLIDLPGTYRTDLSLAVRAELQQGVLLTFLQHGKTRKLAKQPVPIEIDPTGDGTANLRIQYRPCSGYRHQDAWKSLVDGKGRLVRKSISIEGPLAPGAAVRHNAFSGQTKLEEPPERALVLIFALVGCLPLAINPVTGALLVPEVDDLQQFAEDRPRMTPHTPQACRIGGAGDAAFQTMLRLRARRLAGRHGFRGLHVNVLAPTAWASQQKTRTRALFVPASDDIEGRQLARFDRILRALPPRLRNKTADNKVGRKKAGTQTIWFWTDSVVRPFAADNLAQEDRRWYDDFRRLFVDRATREKIPYELQGLQLMVNNDRETDNPIHDDEEMAFIRAFHRAIFLARGRIYQDTMGAVAAKARAKPNQATKNRWKRLMERIRLSLINAKTSSQTQDAISEVLARTGIVTELRDQKALQQVKNLLFGADWQRARDLALFAVASYQRPPDVPDIPDEAEADHESENLQPAEQTP